MGLHEDVGFSVARLADLDRSPHRGAKQRRLFWPAGHHPGAEASPDDGHFPEEIVTCRLQDGTRRRVFCRNAAPTYALYGHLGGVAYSREAYRRVARPS